MLGKKIPNLTALKVASLNRKSVIVPGHKTWKRPRPAGFIIRLQGIKLLELFALGMYEYVKPSSESND